MPNFNKVENFIRSNYDDSTYRAVLLNVEPLNFTVLKDADAKGDIWVPACRDIQWEKPVYKLSYKQDGGEYEEIFNSKGVLESWILQLIAGDAECLRAFSLVDQ